MCIDVIFTKHLLTLFNAHDKYKGRSHFDVLSCNAMICDNASSNISNMLEMLTLDVWVDVLRVIGGSLG